MSNANEIGTKLVELCKQGKNGEAIESLYADDVVSVEAGEGGQFPRELQGKGKILEKNQWWGENHEVHSGEVSGPFPHGTDRFAVIFSFDITNKPSKQRFQLEEVGVYHVSEGAIVREEFFYSMG